MKIFSVYTFSNGNELLIYQNETDNYSELYYHDYAEDDDKFICHVDNADLTKLASN